MSRDATPPMPVPPRTPRAVAILPARLGSTRLARKMLLRETGAYLFEESARNVARCARIARVVVATDSREILEAAREVGLECLMTRADHPSGTDRVHEAATQLAARGERFEVVLGVQGDEPELEPDELAALVEAFTDPAVELATLAAPIEDEDEARAASVVKVVLDRNGDALYFSRAPIPDRSHARAGSRGLGALRRHVGVYAFRPEALARFAGLAPGELETEESLEQLRWLEAGGRIRVVASRRSPRGVDTAADYAAFVARRRAARQDPEDGAAPPNERAKDRVSS